MTPLLFSSVCSRVCPAPMGKKGLGGTVLHERGSVNSHERHSLLVRRALGEQCGHCSRGRFGKQ